MPVTVIALILLRHLVSCLRLVRRKHEISRKHQPGSVSLDGRGRQARGYRNKDGDLG